MVPEPVFLSVWLDTLGRSFISGSTHMFSQDSALDNIGEFAPIVV